MLSRVFWSGVLLVTTIHSSSAQIVDTLWQLPSSGNELVVSAFSFHLSPKKRTYASGVLNYKQLMSGDGSSIQYAINTIPGVFYESRGNGGSPRINIRGSMFRSAYGVRNVRLYWEGFALTSADGTSPIEVIDPSWMESLEVVKGPASVQYGNGAGGALLMSSHHSEPEKISVRYYQALGSFGFNQRNIRATVPLPSMRILSRRYLTVYSSQSQTNGYREQEANQRNMLMLVLRKKISIPWFGFRNSYVGRGENITVVQGYNGGWQLPGSLTESEARINPQQARPYSIAQDAHLNRSRWMLGFGQDRQGERWNFMWRTAWVLNQKENPYGTSSANQGFKKEKGIGRNARVNLNYHLIENENTSIEWIVGGEWQQENYLIHEYVNESGKPGAEKYHFVVDYNQAFAYSALQWKWKNKALLEAGAANHLTKANVDGEYGPNNFNDQINWKPGWTPRVACSWEPFSNFVLFASTAKGFSNPNFFEQVDYQNAQYNNGLAPELGQQKECGARWIKENFSIEGVLYQQKLKSLILPTSITIDSPWSYANSGKSKVQGGECSIKKKWKYKNNEWEIQSAFHWGDYRWTQWSLANQNYDGKKIPGNSGHAAHLMLTYSHDQSFFVILQDQWIDRMALNNSNTIFSNPYHIFNGKVMGVFGESFLRDGAGYMKWEVGVNNILNARYCSFWQWNDSNNRFYNPSPSRNFYTGLTWFFSK